MQDVATIDWQDVLGTSDHVNKVVERFSVEFSFMIEKHAPFRQIRVPEKYRPWINADLKRLIRTRDRLERFAVKHKSQIISSSYKQCRNQMNTLNVTLKKQNISPIKSYNRSVVRRNHGRLSISYSISGQCQQILIISTILAKLCFKN